MVDSFSRCENKNIPMQTNSYDCEVLTCLYARCLAERLPFNFSQEDISSYRKQIVSELLYKELFKCTRTLYTDEIILYHLINMKIYVQICIIMLHHVILFGDFLCVVWIFLYAVCTVLTTHLPLKILVQQTCCNYPMKVISTITITF